jgi:putative membrane protein
VETLTLLFKTVLLRPYVFLFLAAFLFAARRLLGWRRTVAFFLIGWVTAFVCEFSSTRNGVPFGSYYYTGSTVGQELYLSNIPFMDSLSFTFLLYASYCVSLLLLLPPEAAVERASRRLGLRFDLGARTSWRVFLLTTVLYVLIDVVIDPVALRGDRWFLGQIYGYTYPGVYFGVPVENFIGWGVVGAIALSGYFAVDRKLGSTLPVPSERPRDVAMHVLLGCALYAAVLLFNLAVTFWIGEFMLGLAGLVIFSPLTALAVLRLSRRPAGSV